MVFLGSQNSKCQVQAKFQWGGGGVFLGSQNSKCQVLAKFQFFLEGEPKLEVPSPGQISMRGGDWVVKTKLKVPSYGQI